MKLLKSVGGISLLLVGGFFVFYGVPNFGFFGLGDEAWDILINFFGVLFVIFGFSLLLFGMFLFKKKTLMFNSRLNLSKS